MKPLELTDAEYALLLKVHEKKLHPVHHDDLFIVHLVSRKLLRTKLIGAGVEHHDMPRLTGTTYEVSLTEEGQQALFIHECLGEPAVLRATAAELYSVLAQDYLDD